MDDLEQLSHPEVIKLVEGDLEPVLPPKVRQAMLDLILAWADLDGSTAFLAASLGGMNPDQGAERYGRKVIADKLKVAAKSLAVLGKDADALLVQTISDEYPDRALLRKRIAHSRCGGVRKSDPSRVVFLPYEREGPVGHLAIEIYGVEEFAKDTQWARRVHATFMAFLDRTGFFETDVEREMPKEGEPAV